MTRSEREELIEYLRSNVSGCVIDVDNDYPIMSERILFRAEDVFKAIRGFIRDEDMKAQPNWEAECKRLRNECECLHKAIEELQHVIDTKYGDYERLRLIVSHIETLTGRKFE